jgi:hypothetical protein
MINLLLFLLPKLIAAVLLWCAIHRFRRAQRKGHLVPWHFFDVGAWGYNFVSLWVTGWLGVLVNALFWFCITGSLASMAWSIWCDARQRWQVSQERKVIAAQVASFSTAERLWKQGTLSDREFDVFLDTMRQEISPLTIVQREVP